MKLQNYNEMIKEEEAKLGRELTWLEASELFFSFENQKIKKCY